MKTIEDRIHDLVNQFDELVELEKDSNKLQSEYDLELSRLYHVIEGSSFTHVSQSHNLMKELQDVLLKRRDNKFDNALLKNATVLLGTNIKALKARIEVRQKKKETYFVEIKEFAKNN
jgi:hypothetical protein